MPGLKIKIDTNEAERASRQLRKELKALGSEAVNDEKDFKKLESRLRKGMKSDIAKKNIDRLHKSLGLTRLETAKLQRGIGDYSGAIKTMVFGNNAAVASFGGMAAAAGGLLAVLGIGVGIKKSLSEFSDFDKGLISVQKTTNLTDFELNVLSNDIRKMSKHIPVTTNKLLEIAEAAGQLGVKGVSNIKIFTETLAMLETASDISGEEAAKKLARLLNVTGENISSIDTLGSVIVALGNNMAASESEIVSLATEVGQATSVFAVTSAEATALAAAMKSIGVRAELGGSVVGRSMRAIEASIESGGESFEYLQHLTKMTDEQLRETFDKNATQVFKVWLDGAGRMIKGGQSAASVFEKFGLKGEEVLKVLPAMATKSHILAEALSIANAEVKDSNALTEEAIRASSSFSAQMTMTMSAVDEIASSIGSGLAPEIIKAAKNFRQWSEDNEEFINQDIPKYVGEISSALASLAVIAEPTAWVVSKAFNIITQNLPTTPLIKALNLYKKFEQLQKKIIENTNNIVSKPINSSTPGYDDYAADLNFHLPDAVGSTGTPDKTPLGDVEQQLFEDKLSSGLNSLFSEYENMEDKLYSEMQDSKNKQIELQKQFQDEYDRIVLSSFDVERKELQDQTIRWEKQGQDKIQIAKAQAVVLADIAEREAEDLNQRVEATLDGFFSDLEEMETQAEASAGFMSEAFSGWANSLSQDLRDLVLDSDSSFKEILGSYIDMLGQMILQKKAVEPLLNFSGKAMDKGFSMIGGLFKDFDMGSLFGEGTSIMNFDPFSLFGDSFLQFGNGGIIDEHILGIGLNSGRSYEFGENGTPEAVVPKKDWGGGNPGKNKTSTVYNVNIYANDAKSFDEMLKRHPGRIIKMVSDGMTGNTGLRKTMKGTM